MCTDLFTGCRALEKSRKQLPPGALPSKEVIVSRL